MRSPVKAFMLAAFLLFGVGLKAQTFTAHYEYDLNGNRLSATIIYLSKAPTTPSAEVSEEIKVDEQTSLTINIFPNPTQGDLRVELAGASPEQLNAATNAIRVWDMQGRLLFSVSPIGTTNSVDLSKYNNGTYIMQLFFGGKVKDFKIIKN